jgi:hypothetical protein
VLTAPAFQPKVEWSPNRILRMNWCAPYEGRSWLKATKQESLSVL